MAPENAKIHRPINRKEPSPREGSALQASGKWELVLTGFLFLFGGAILLLSRPNGTLTLGTILGSLTIPAFLMAAFHAYVSRWQTRELRNPRNLRIVALLVLLVALICRLFLTLTHSIHAGFSFIPASSLEYSLPVALGGVLFSVIFNPRLAFAGSLGITILLAFFSSDPFSFFLVSFVGSMVGISSLVGYQERTSFLKAGGRIGMANMATILVLAFLYQKTASLPYDLICGAVSGVLVGILGLGLLPSLEYLFDITTNFKLLELSNLHQSMLRQLILVAPGTYHHSIVMGTLAEAAADRRQFPPGSRKRLTTISERSGSPLTSSRIRGTP
jgi:membrane-associated HD superfamily phosphohydrolase